MAILVTKKKLDAGSYQLKDQVVAINRVTEVVKSGKNMSFAALVVVGDPSAGVVGYGSGKAKEVPQAIRRGIESAKKNLIKVHLNQTSIPHTVLGRFGGGMVLLKPAPEGTGVIAGGAVRAVMTSVGVQDVLTKSIGTNNPHTVIKATFDALNHLCDHEEVARLGAVREFACSVAHQEHPALETDRDTLEWRKRFMSENKCWSSADVARESGSSAKNQAAIASRWLQEKRIFSIIFEGKIWFPRLQFRDGRPISAVANVIKAFPEHATGWDLAYFFTTPNSFIGGRKPLELLKDDPKRLESLARSFANPADAF